MVLGNQGLGLAEECFEVEGLALKALSYQKLISCNHDSSLNPLTLNPYSPP